MKVVCLGSSSAGNGYLVRDGIETLIIECGVGIREVLKEMDFDLTTICGALVSHEHGDHAGYVKQYLSANIPLYMTQGTAEGLGIKGRGVNAIEYKKKYQIGGFKVLPFETEHDSNQPCGFLIDCPSGNRILFVTDTYYLKYSFNGVNIFMIECNYDENKLRDNLKNKTIHPKVASRVRKSHLSFGRCVQVLLASDLTKAKEIILLHLSDKNSNEKKFISEITKLTGKVVVVAQKKSSYFIV